MKHKVGDRVRIIAGQSGGLIIGITCPDALNNIGKEGMVTWVGEGKAVPYIVCIVKVLDFVGYCDADAALPYGEIECLPEWLEPILRNSGHQKVSWKECVWQPPHLREVEKAHVSELVDERDLKSLGEGRAGSSPAVGTR